MIYDNDGDDDIGSGKQPTSYFLRVRICFEGVTLVATVVTLEKGLLWLVQAQLLLYATLADMVILTLG